MQKNALIIRKPRATHRIGYSIDKTCNPGEEIRSVVQEETPVARVIPLRKRAKRGRKRAKRGEYLSTTMRKSATRRSTTGRISLRRRFPWRSRCSVGKPPRSDMLRNKESKLCNML